MTTEKDILAAISPDEALEVLQELTKDPRIRKRAQALALAMVGDVDPDAVAEEVFYELDSIAVEDVWDNSGATRDGYVDSGEYAWELFAKALGPFEEHLRKCHKLSLPKQAKLQCMGLLKGIWQFESESSSEFKDWAVDAPEENMARIFDEWRKGSKNPQDIAEVRNFMESMHRG
jgi:hypothetical protein